MTDIRVGDRFMVEVEVRSYDATGYYVETKSGAVTLCRETLLASERLPRKIAEGDKVTLRNNRDLFGTVVAVNETRAWVDWALSGGGSGGTIEKLSNLEPAP